MNCGQFRFHKENYGCKTGSSAVAAPPCDEWKVERRRTSATDWWGCQESHEDYMQQRSRTKAAVAHQTSKNNWNLTHPPSLGCSSPPQEGSFFLYTQVLLLQRSQMSSVSPQKTGRESFGFHSATCEGPLIVSESGKRNVVKLVGGCRLREEGMPASWI